MQNTAVYAPITFEEIVMVMIKGVIIRDNYNKYYLYSKPLLSFMLINFISYSTLCVAKHYGT